MPVTAKLPKKFYETFGDDIANELVEWFNVVDAAYRSDLRELNELNFARFEARLSERATASEAMFDRRVSEVEAGLNRRISEVEFRLDRRITEVEVGLDRRISEVESGLNQRIADLEGRMDAGFERLRAEMIKWSFLFWMGMVVTVFVSRFIRP